MHEPYLIQIGFLARTSRGRVATELAYRHLGITPPDPEYTREPVALPPRARESQLREIYRPLVG